MKITKNNPFKSEQGLLVLPFFIDSLKKFPTNYPSALKDLVKNFQSSKDFSAKQGETVFAYIDKKDLPGKLLLLGLGKHQNFKKSDARNFGGKIGKEAKHRKMDEISIYLPKELEEHAGELLEGLVSAQYDLGKLKTTAKKDSTYELKKLNFISPGKGVATRIERAQLIAEETEFVKDLVNFPSNVVDADYLEKEARRIAKENSYKITVLKNKELEKGKWGGILSVNQGSIKEARCLVLEYAGAKNKNEKPIALVGKGVIFDTGGYNLKPTNSIETMHQDMAGGATVLGVFALLKKLGVKKNVIGIIPIVENLISAKAYRPSDIIKMYSGKTVEITNTDAEGRLILADAVYHAAKFKPASIITIATLTGAVAIALGPRFAGLVGNDRALRSQLQKAGSEVDELAWPLPLINDYRKKMDSRVADMRNYDMESGRYAGSSKGGAFIERFVEKNKWCHIDIGGTAFTDDPKEYQTRGATAHGLQMLLRFLES